MSSSGEGRPAVKRDDLRERIAEAWREAAAAGEPMPAEPALAQRLMASRPAVREALVRLEEQGYIRRRQGADTAVNRRMLDITGRIDVQIDRSELIAATGRVPSITVVSNVLDRVTGAEAERYQLRRDQPVARVTKVWSADGVPVIRADDAIPVTEGVTAIEDATAPVWDIAARFGLGTVAWEIVNPAAVAASHRDAELLGIAPGIPVLVLDSLGVTRDGTTAYWAADLHAGNAFKHTIIRNVRH